MLLAVTQCWVVSCGSDELTPRNGDAGGHVPGPPGGNTPGGHVPGHGGGGSAIPFDTLYWVNANAGPLFDWELSDGSTYLRPNKIVAALPDKDWGGLGEPRAVLESVTAAAQSSPAEPSVEAWLRLDGAEDAALKPVPSPAQVGKLVCALADAIDTAVPVTGVMCVTQTGLACGQGVRDLFAQGVYATRNGTRFGGDCNLDTSKALAYGWLGPPEEMAAGAGGTLGQYANLDVVMGELYECAYMSVGACKNSSQGGAQGSAAASWYTTWSATLRGSATFVGAPTFGANAANCCTAPSELLATIQAFISGVANAAVKPTSYGVWSGGDANNPDTCLEGSAICL